MFDMPAEEAKPVAAASRRLHGRVLLVEDNPVNLQVARRLLGLAGLDIDTAGNGQAALDCLADAHYDLVLMDCQMPVMDGYEATRRIRASGHPRAQVPIIALTAHALAEDRQRCEAAGMNDYLPKPVTSEALAGVLQRHLGPRGA